MAHHPIFGKKGVSFYHFFKNFRKSPIKTLARTVGGINSAKATHANFFDELDMIFLVRVEALFIFFDKT